jgi:hypothetical protein
VKLGDSEEKCSCWYTMKEYTLAPVAERFLRVRRKVLRVCLALLRQPSPTIKCAILWETNILFKLFSVFNCFSRNVCALSTGD